MDWVEYASPGGGGGVSGGEGGGGRGVHWGD